MSERIYALLLRLYPAHFRVVYGDEALQLFRDRAWEEEGPLRQLRLWMDLLADLAVSLPYEHRRADAVLARFSTQRATGPSPMFCVLSDEPPHPGLLLCAGAVSLGVFLAAFGFMAFIASRPRQSSGPVNRLALMRVGQPHQTYVSLVCFQSGAVVAELDNAEQRRVLEAVVTNLKEHYFDQVLGQKMADKLLANEGAGDYHSITDGAVLAGVLTKQIREVSRDLHLEVVYSQRPLPDVSAGPSPEDLAQYKNLMLQENCSFEKVTILPRNIGYIKLNSFPDPSICGSKTKEVMASLNNVSAMIFDLRDNRGGAPEMTELIAGYLFDHPEYWYNPREAPTRQSWTLSPVPGNRLADKPVYILTSSRTISGGEQFCYNLKMLKRATLVGETTHGSAHAGVWRRIDDHFGMGIPEAKAINPYWTPDWEGMGVNPTMSLKAADALPLAEQLAWRGILKSQ